MKILVTFKDSEAPTTGQKARGPFLIRDIYPSDMLIGTTKEDYV